MLSRRRQFDFLWAEAADHAESRPRPRSRVDGTAGLEPDGADAKQIRRLGEIHEATCNLLSDGGCGTDDCSLVFAPLPLPSPRCRLSRSARIQRTFSAGTACCAIPTFRLGKSARRPDGCRIFRLPVPAIVKSSRPSSRRFVREDGNIRLCLKDWPIFGDVSVSAAKLALACQISEQIRRSARRLDRSNTKLTAATISDLLAKAGVDVAVATADLQAHRKVD